MSHWLDDAARGLADGTHSRRDVLRRGTAAAGGALLASLASPLGAQAAGRKRCPDGHHCGRGTICCDKDCCDPDTETCIFGQCCDNRDVEYCKGGGGRFCRGPDFACCHDKGLYDPKRGKCCPGKTFHVCRKNEECCGDEHNGACCKEGETCCEGREDTCCKPGEECLGGECLTNKKVCGGKNPDDCGACCGQAVGSIKLGPICCPKSQGCCCFKTGQKITHCCIC